MDAEQTNLNFKQIFNILRHRARWIALCWMAVTAAAFLFSVQQDKKYTATASLLFSTGQLSQQIAGLPLTSTINQQAQESTNVKLVQLGDMAERTAAQLGGGLTKAAVAESLSISPQGESNIVDVAATSTSPTLAAAIANTYTQQFVSEQQGSNHRYYTSALALVNRQLAALPPSQRLSSAGLALEGRAQSLSVLAELRNGNVQVAQGAAVPSSPSSPKTKRNTILGALLGLMLGLAVALLVDRLDRRIREPGDLERIYELPLLGVVPHTPELARPGERRRVGTELEAFQMIRAHLRYFNVDRPLRVVMIASAAPGDGKTTVARNLAEAAARMDARVLLLEVDLRRPTVARQLGIHFSPGLSDVLIDAVSLEEAIQPVALDGAPAGHRLDVVVAGATLPPNPAALIESNAMHALLERVQAEYDLVVLDTPPLTVVSDAFPLLGRVDGVIIVGWLGRNRRDVAQRLRDSLRGAGAPLLGVVANGYHVRGLGAYGYSAYGYSYESQPQHGAAHDADEDARWPAGIGWPDERTVGNGSRHAPYVKS
jgi:capsular exopolysaccharide synthesis family protein